MPSSFVDSVPGVIHCIIAADATSICDVGPGWGKYGLMCREYLPDLERLDAVEVEEGHRCDTRSSLSQPPQVPSIADVQDVLYDTLYITDVRLLAPEFWEVYDAALLIDVIEHITIEEGHNLLSAMLHYGCAPVVSTPKIFAEQHDDHNPYEEHVSLWTWKEFSRYDVIEDRSTVSSIIYRLGEL